MITEFWPLVKLATQCHSLINQIIGLFEDACWISVLVAGVVGCQSVFGHVIW
jgi:hypothetical protein